MSVLRSPRPAEARPGMSLPFGSSKQEPAPQVPLFPLVQGRGLHTRLDVSSQHRQKVTWCSPISCRYWGGGRGLGVPFPQPPPPSLPPGLPASLACFLLVQDPPPPPQVPPDGSRRPGIGVLLAWFPAAVASGGLHLWRCRFQLPGASPVSCALFLGQPLSAVTSRLSLWLHSSAKTTGYARGLPWKQPQDAGRVSQ